MLSLVSRDGYAVGMLANGKNPLRRVAVLAPAEALRIEAANRLLKLLEEPPPASVFVVASDALDAAASRLCREKCSVTAVDEITPPRAPAIVSPRLAPTVRRAT